MAGCSKSLSSSLPQSPPINLKPIYSTQNKIQTGPKIGGISESRQFLREANLAFDRGRLVYERRRAILDLEERGVKFRTDPLVNATEAEPS